MELYRGLQVMQKRSGKTVTELFVGGGGARSDIVCQITADLFGLPVKRIQTHEASAIGSSMAAFVALGTFRDYDDALAHMVQQTDTFEPNETNHAIYMDFYSQVYHPLSGKLKRINKNITNLLKRRA